MAEGKRQAKAFISYASKDKKFFEQLVEGLKGHSHGSSVIDWNFWDDREILMGSSWHDSIQTALEESDFAILLVSRNFVNSSYIQEHELENFLTAQNERGFLIFPVLVLPYDISRVPSIANLQFFKPLYRDYFYSGRLSESTELMPFSKVAKDEDLAEEYYIDLVEAIEKALKASMEKKQRIAKRSRRSFIGSSRNFFPKVTWKTAEGNYWLYVNGEHVPGTQSSYVNNDVIVYLPKPKRTYLLVDYKASVDGVEKEAEFLTSSNAAFFMKHDKTFRLFVEGIEMTNSTANAWVDDSLIVFETQNRRHFLFEDFSNKYDGHLYPAKELFSKSNSLNTAFYTKYGETFRLYVEGTEMTSTTTNTWVDDSLIVFESKNKRHFLFKDFKLKNNDLYAAEELYSQSNVFWKQRDGLYSLYVEGVNRSSESDSRWIDNDLIVKDNTTGKEYILKDFYANGDNQLREAPAFS